MSECVVLRKFVISIIIILGIAYNVTRAHAKDVISPLWQKIEDARIYMNEGKLPDARIFFTQALDMAEKGKDRTAEAICVGNLGTIHDMMEEYEKAIGYYLRGYRISVEVNNKLLESKFSKSLARKYIQMENRKEARKWFDIQSSLILDEDERGKFDMYYNKSGVLMMEGNVVSALYYMDCARRQAEEDNLGPKLIGATLMGKGAILYNTKRYEEAVAEYRRGYDLIRKGGNKAQEIMASRALYVAYNHLGDSVRAARYKENYLNLTESAYDPAQARTASKRLDDFEKKQNENSYNIFQDGNFFLISLVVVLGGIVAFVSVLLYKSRRSHRELLSSREMSGFIGEQQTARENKTLSRAAVEDKTDSLMLPEQRKALVEKISLVMENVNMICGEDFSLSQLAKTVKSNTKYVSFVINETYGKSFKTYLNEYRIAEACRRLVDQDNYGNFTIRAIHQELGFKTAASFVAAFRKVIGMTPSEYKKMHSTSRSGEMAQAEEMEEVTAGDISEEQREGDSVE